MDGPPLARSSLKRRRCPVKVQTCIGEPCSVNLWLCHRYSFVTIHYPQQLILGRQAPISKAAQARTCVNQIDVANAVAAVIYLRQCGVDISEASPPLCAGRAVKVGVCSVPGTVGAGGSEGGVAGGNACEVSGVRPLTRGAAGMVTSAVFPSQTRPVTLSLTHCVLA